MITGILVTDGGPHSAEDWAYASASMLLEWFTVDPNSPRRIKLEMAKDKARPLIATVLVEHHASVQTLERKALAKDPSRFAEPDHTIAAEEHVEIDDAVNDIFDILEPLLEKAQLFIPGIVGETDMGKYVKGVIWERVNTDLRSVMKVERQWHADRIGSTPKLRVV